MNRHSKFDSFISTHQEFLLISILYLTLTVIFFGYNFIHEYIFADFLLQWVEHYYYLLLSVHSGYIPLWDPYSFMGVPGIFHPLYMFAYLPITIFLLLQYIINPSVDPNFLGKSLELFAYLHIFVGMITMYFLLRKKIFLGVHASIAGGIIFGFSLYTTKDLEVLAPLAGLMLLPLIIYALLTFLENMTYKNLLFVVLMNYLIFTLSYPYYQIYFFYTQLGLAAFWGISKFLRTGFAIGIAILLAGILLIPQAYVYSQAYRFVDATNSQIHIAASFPTINFLNVLVPQGYSVGGSMNWGVIPFIFIIIGLVTLKRNKITLWLITIFAMSLFLSLGGYIGIENLLGVPPFFQDKLRAHGQILAVTFFIGTIISAIGIDNVLKGEKVKVILLFLFGLVLVTSGSFIFLLINCTNCINFGNEMTVQIGRMLVLFTIGLALIALQSRFNTKIFFYLMLIISVLDCYYYYDKLPNLHLGTSYKNYFGKNSLIPEMPTKDNLFRVLPGDDQFSGTTSYLKLFGYNGSELVMHKASYDIARFGYPKAFQIANLKYMIYTQPIPYSNFTLVKKIKPSDHPNEVYVSSAPWSPVSTPKSTNTHYIYELKDYLPRFFAPQYAQSCPDKSCYLREDPPKLVFIKEPNINIQNPTNNEVKLKIISYDPNIIRIAINTPNKTFIASSEIWDKGWSIKINGKSDHVYDVMDGFRGFIVDKGKSTVEMSYFPPYFYYGLISSLLGLLLLFLLRLKKLNRFILKDNQKKHD